MNVWEVLFLFFAFQAFLLAVLFRFRRTEGFGYSNRIFACFLLAMGWMIGYSALYWSGFLNASPWLHLGMTYLIPFSLFAPLFFFYIRNLVDGQRVHGFRDLIHLLPVLYMLYKVVPYLVLSADAKLEARKISAQRYLEIGFGVHDAIEMGVSLLMGVYGVAILVRYSKKFKGDREFLLWLQWITGAFLLCAASFILYYLLYWTGMLSLAQDYFISLLLSVSVLMATYFSFNFPKVFEGRPFQELVPFMKYRKTGLSEAYSQELKESLLDHMVREKPHLQGDLRLDDLAEAMGVSRHHASQVINKHFDANFFEFVNLYRVEEAQRIIEEDRERMNLSEIGFLAGFNNTVSFNKAFKKQTGVTPSQYRKALSSSAS